MSTWPATRPARARVEERIFQGATERIVIVTTAGTRLSVIAAGIRAAAPVLRAGDRVWGSVSPEDIVVLAE